MRALWLLPLTLLFACDGGEDKTDTEEPSDTEESTDTEASSDTEVSSDTEDTEASSDTEDTEKPTDTEDTEDTEVEATLDDGRYVNGRLSISTDSCSLGDPGTLPLQLTTDSDGLHMELPDSMGTFDCEISGSTYTCDTLVSSNSSGGLTVEYAFDQSGEVIDSTSFRADHDWVIDCRGADCGEGGVSWPCDFAFSATFSWTEGEGDTGGAEPPS